MWKRLICLAVISALCAPCALAQPNPIVTHVDATYAIYAGGMRLIDAELKIDVDEMRYDSHLTARTMGIIGKIFKWWNNVSSKGNVEPRKLQSTEHISENSWMGDRRSVTLIYDGKGGFLKKETFPAPAAENREEVAEVLTKDTQDLMSAGLTLLQRVSQGESCDQTIAVYDGRRRFNLKFKAAGSETLPHIKYGIFAGEAQRCEMTIERVAGYWKKYQTEWTEDGDAKMKVIFWLAPVKPGGPLVPVRATSSGDFGTAIVHLTGGTMDGQNIKELLAQKP